MKAASNKKHPDIRMDAIAKGIKITFLTCSGLGPWRRSPQLRDISEQRWAPRPN
jgi:hypothetical protein